MKCTSTNFHQELVEIFQYHSKRVMKNSLICCGSFRETNPAAPTIHAIIKQTMKMLQLFVVRFLKYEHWALGFIGLRVNSSLIMFLLDSTIYSLNPFQACVPFLFPMKMSENIWFRKYWFMNEILSSNRLNNLNSHLVSFEHKIKTN